MVDQTLAVKHIQAAYHADAQHAALIAQIRRNQRKNRSLAQVFASLFSMIRRTSPIGAVTPQKEAFQA